MDGAADRIASLEGQLKLTRLFALGALAIAIVAPLAIVYRVLPNAFRNVTTQTLTVQSLAVVDPDGKPKVLITGERSGGALSIRDADGKPALTMSSSPLMNYFLLASKATNPDLGFSVDSTEAWTTLRLHHQKTKPEVGELTGEVYLQSSSQDIASLSLFGPNGSAVVADASERAGRVRVLPPQKQGSKVAWADFAANVDSLHLEMHSEAGSAQMALFGKGAFLQLEGPHPAQLTSESIAKRGSFSVHADADAGTLQLQGKGGRISGYTGAAARLSTDIGSDKVWSSPTPSKLASN